MSCSTRYNKYNLLATNIRKNILKEMYIKYEG